MKLLKINLTTILVIAILIFGLFLRRHDMYLWPRIGATFDEYAWTWQGVSLLTKGVPTSWSFHPQYKHRKEIRYQKAAFILVTPYLEHPPVFGLVAGSYAMLRGATGMFDINILKIRSLSLILSAVSMLFVYLLANKLYGKSIGIISLLLYSTVPTIVIGSRIVQNENFFIPVWLITLFLITRFIDEKKSWQRNLAAVLCGILMLAKVPWVAAPFSICIILIANRRFGDIRKFLIVVLPIFALYFIYGFYYDKDVFLGLWGLQLNRYDISFASIFALFQKPYLVDRFYTDGWILFGWISFILLLIKPFKKNIIIISAFLSYFLVYITAIPDEASHGWYRYPFYPFLIISTAIFIKEYFAKNFLLTFLFVTLIGTSLLGLTWERTFGFSYLIFRTVLILFGLLLIPEYLNNLAFKRCGKLISYIFLGLFVLFNIWAIMIYNEL